MGVISVQKVKGLISLELNSLDSRFNKTRFLNIDDARKVLLHILSKSNCIWWTVIEIRFMVISEQIGCNNHLQTLFRTHSYILLYRKSAQHNSITSKHYFTLSPVFCQISITSKHYFTLIPVFCQTPITSKLYLTLIPVFCQIPITSKHYFTLIPVFCQIPITSKHYITLLKHFKQSQEEYERVWEWKKDGLALKIQQTVISVLVV